jgi:8-oxo-dGTP pyrophosphatase MutT (NUDIX family)
VAVDPPAARCADFSQTLFLVIQKAAACVVRTGLRGPELLAFRHPVAGVQIPKGSVEPGEDPGDAVLRELAEESGISGARIVRGIGLHELEVETGPTETGPPEIQVWHTFLIAVDQELPDAWSHHVLGSEVEAGLMFDYFWLPIQHARAAFTSRYHASIDFVIRELAIRSSVGG